MATSALQNNAQATQTGIIGQQLFNNSLYYSGQKYGEVINLSNNVNYSISPNAVKLLPVVSNDNNYVKLYTQTNASVEVGDMVYIMYDENMSADPQEKYIFPSGRTILDSFYEFSGCTDWIYLKQIQGYPVISVNEANNEITIGRYYDSSLNNIQLYNHYLCKIYVNNMNFYAGWVDGVSFRKVEFNTLSDSYIDVDIKQCIILSGTNSYYTEFTDKYDNQYVSVNSDLVSNTKKLPPTINPYKYKPTNIIQSNQSLTNSYFTYNNKLFGYSYLYNTNIYNTIIDNGYYQNCVISGGTLYGGTFTNCNLYDVQIQSGSFTNCTINPNSTWYYGIWYGSGTTTFGPNVWNNGIWNEGIFSGKTWISGIFNAGWFTHSVWVTGIFNGGSSPFVTNQDNFNNSYWSGGTFNNGYFHESIWSRGMFNGGRFIQSNWFGGIFNGGNFSNSYWSGGTFNNGTFNSSYWFDGTFNGGNFLYSIWYNGVFNNGVFKTGFDGEVYAISGNTYKWYNGIFNFGEFNNSIWMDGIFNNGFIKNNSLWSGGTFNFGEFNDSIWVNGDWNDGIVNNSTFNKCNWISGTFNSGYFGKEYAITSPILYTIPEVYWSGGTFNGGQFGTPNNSSSKIYWFGGDFYGGKFYNYLYSPANPTQPTYGFPGFYDGIFHEGYFYGDYWGGQWVNGFFSSTSHNHTSQIIPKSWTYNYIVNTQINIQTQME